DSGIFRSRDSGTTWTLVGLSRRSIRAISAEGSSILVETDSGLYSSTDDGDHWEAKGFVEDRAESLLVTDAGWFIGTNGIFRSTNRGKTWPQASIDLKGDDLN